MFVDLLQRLEPFSRVFAEHGKQVYLVGGAVRNLLLGRPVKDFDFTTDAHPAEVQTYFRRVLPTGLQHGTVTVLFQGEPYEVTTFRVDGAYSDGRRPDAVQFTPSLGEDLKRRDFTINAIALNLATGELCDPHNGAGDLRLKLLRAIGEPGHRFDEDALRVLRLFRFAAQLGFDIDPATFAAVAPRRAHLAAVSRERIREELAKSLAGASPRRAWSPLTDLGILADLFEPLVPRPLLPQELDTLETLAPNLRWSYWMTLTCGNDRDAWKAALKRLTFSNLDQEAVLGPARVWDLLTAGSLPTQGAKAIVERWGHRDRVVPGIEYLKALEDVGYWSDDGWKSEILRASQSLEPIFLNELAISGNDLLAAGVPPGPRVGETLRQLQRVVWSDPSTNQVETLTRLLPSLR